MITIEYISSNKKGFSLDEIFFNNSNNNRYVFKVIIKWNEYVFNIYKNKSINFKKYAYYYNNISTSAKFNTTFKFQCNTIKELKLNLAKELIKLGFKEKNKNKNLVNIKEKNENFENIIINNSDVIKRLAKK